MAVLVGHGRRAADYALDNRAARSPLPGNLRTRLRGGGMVWEAVRPYAAGDDIRHIDWRVSARQTDIYTRIYEAERELPVHLVVDQRPQMFFASRGRFKSVLAAELAACLCWGAQRSHSRITAQLFGPDGRHQLRIRRAGLLPWLARLCRCNNSLHASSSGGAPLAAMLAETAALMRQGSALFVISDLADLGRAAERQLRALSRRASVCLLRIYDDLERRWPDGAAYSISDGRSRASVRLTAAMRRRYGDRAAAHNARLHKLCRGGDITMLDISTADDPAACLRRFLQGRP